MAANVWSVCANDIFFKFKSTDSKDTNQTNVRGYHHIRSCFLLCVLKDCTKVTNEESQLDRYTTQRTCTLEKKK